VDLFAFADSRPPNYRPSDPKTSRDAGRSAHSFTAEHHQAILNVLRRAGRPMACEEIAQAMAFDYARGKASIALDAVACGKRSVELIRAGLIERTAETHINKSGRSAFKLRIRRQPDEAAIPRG
jgi:hypothetical protein